MENTNKDPVKNLDKYTFMTNILRHDPGVFYSMVSNNVVKYMPYIYTPCVGDACKNFSRLYGKTRGLYITLGDDIQQVINNYCSKNGGDKRIAVITDGERILGLGDLGADGMGISIGKLQLYTVCGGILPEECLPITLDVGTNNGELLESVYYKGLRKSRPSEEVFDKFVEEVIRCLMNKYPNILIQFEDFGNHNAFKLLNKYRNEICCFNDDIQGTAAVVLAGLLSACKAKGTVLRDEVFLFLGAGEAGVGIADLIVKHLVLEGMTEKDAIKRCILMDMGGLITNTRTGLADHKMRYAHEIEWKKTLIEAIEHIKPTAIIGVSTKGGAFDPSIIKKMSEINEQPIIFPLSNPTANSECSGNEAIVYSGGRALFASGSPFDPVSYNGREYVLGQGNNAYIFPGVGLAITLGQIPYVTDDMFLTAAAALSEQVTDDDIATGLLYPPLQTIRKVSIHISTEVIYKHSPLLLGKTEINEIIENYVFKPAKVYI